MSSRRKTKQDGHLIPILNSSHVTSWLPNRMEISLGFSCLSFGTLVPMIATIPLFRWTGKTLREAKIIAFGVKKAYRRRGIGRGLQEYTLKRAKELDCYQVRSVSDMDHTENHQLKLSMGFAVEPMEREEPSLAFIMPLSQIKK